MQDHFKTQLRKARAAMVAEFTFKQKLERIEWEENVMKPELEKLALQAGETLEIPQFIIEDDSQNDN